MRPQDITIQAGFQKSIPPSTDDENKLLRASIEADGFRDPITVWKETGVLVDGHRRLGIWKEISRQNTGWFSKNPPLQVIERSFRNSEEAQDWIDTNSLARRNLSAEQIALIRGRMYLSQKQPVSGARDAKRTDEKLAEQYDCSPATVRRDADFAAAVASLSAIDPEIEARVIAGDAPARATIIEAAKIVAQHPEQARELLTESEDLKAMRRRASKKPASKSTKRGLSMVFKTIQSAVRQARRSMPTATAEIIRFLKDLLTELESETINGQTADAA